MIVEKMITKIKAAHIIYAVLFCILLAYTISLIENFTGIRVYTSYDSNVKEKIDNVTQFNLKVQSSNLRAVHIPYVQSDEENKNVPVIKLLSDDIGLYQTETEDYGTGFVKINFYPSIKGQKGEELSFSVELNGCSLFMASEGSVQNKQFGLSTKYSIVIAVMCVLLVAVLLIVGLILIRRNIKIEVFFILVSVFIGLPRIFLYDSWNGPDCLVHFTSVYSFSNKMLGIHDQNLMIQQRICDTDIFAGTLSVDKEGYRQEITDNRGRVRDFILHALKSMKNNTSTHLTTIYKGEQTVPPNPGYFLAALAVSIVRILGGNQFVLYYAGIFVNYIFGTICFFFAIKNSSQFKHLYFLTWCMPFVGFLCASYSYDSITIPVAVLLTSLSIELYFKEKIEKKYVALTLFVAVILFFLKGHAYAPLCLFPFFIVALRFYPCKLRKVFMCSFSVIVIVLVLYGVLALTVFPFIKVKPHFLYTTSFVLLRPFKVCNILIKTIGTYTDLFSYEWSFMQSNDNMILLIFTVLLFFITCFKKNLLHDNRIFYITVFLFMLNIFAIIYRFILWYKWGSDIVIDLQARYLLPILPMLFVGLSFSSLPKVSVSSKRLYDLMYIYLLIKFVELLKI